jgi:translation initiation factor 6 (eIF-6)
MEKQESLLLLTKAMWNSDKTNLIDKDMSSKILIGVESIIDVEEVMMKNSKNSNSAVATKIQSRGAMVETNYVLESVEEIYKMYKCK